MTVNNFISFPYILPQKYRFVKYITTLFKANFKYFFIIKVSQQIEKNLNKKYEKYFLHKKSHDCNGRGTNFLSSFYVQIFNNLKSTLNTLPPGPFPQEKVLSRISW